MTVAVWRIASDTPDWDAADLGGLGAAARGARWNHAGERITYASTTVSLAAWETRAHLGRIGTALPFNRYLVRIDIPDAVWAAREQPSGLPAGWDAISEGRVSRAIGSAWLASKRTALLVVPSLVIAEESNVLIDPAHPAAAGITAVKLRRFVYDPRL